MSAVNLVILSFVQQDKNIIYTVSRTEIYGCGVNLNLRSPMRASSFFNQSGRYFVVPQTSYDKDLQYKDHIRWRGVEKAMEWRFVRPKYMQISFHYDLAGNIFECEFQDSS